MSGTWTRNYYNILTAGFGTCTGGTSTVAPSDYSVPVMIRNTSGQWKSVSLTRALVRDQSSYNYLNIGIDYIAMGFLKNPFMYGQGQSTTGQNAIMYSGIQLCNTEATDVSYEDYAVSGAVIPLTLAAQTTTPTTYDAGLHAYSYGKKFTLTNATATNYTVNELALFLGGSLVDSGESTIVLAYHEIFEPITLEPSENLVVTVTASVPVFNYSPYPSV